MDEDNEQSIKPDPDDERDEIIIKEVDVGNGMKQVTKWIKTTVYAPSNDEEAARIKRLSSIEDYFEKVEQVRKEYPHVFENMPSWEEYYAERRREAEREWR